jgi:hypothetical protein
MHFNQASVDVTFMSQLDSMYITVEKIQTRLNSHVASTQLHRTMMQDTWLADCLAYN